VTDDVEHVLVTLPRGDRCELRLSRSRFRGKTKTKLHVWARGSEGLCPTRQVVTIADDELLELKPFIDRIAAKISSRGSEPQVVRETRTKSRPAAAQQSFPAGSGDASNGRDPADPEGLF
jgi:hypothetical protein